MLAFGWASGDMDLKPKRVYIGGGGELATAREVLKHPSVEEVVMVDLDKMVVDVSREQLHEWSTGCFSDPRLTVHYTDAHAWLNRSDADTGLFDLIIMDIADPFEAGPGIALYTQEFYRIAKSKLTPGGVFVTQSGPGGLLTHTECFTSVHRTLQSVFEHVLPYTAEIPSFGSNWGWNLAFDASGVRNSRLSSSEALEAGSTFKDLSMTSLSTRLKSRVDPGGLRFYDGEGHRGIFHISKPIRDSIALEERIITKDNPVFML
uniref:PABS domain-containing protein n=1 Tax=Octactis speculum TaxID=3111310 RepID=A0A7S2CGT9_9STRA